MGGVEELGNPGSGARLPDRSAGFIRQVQARKRAVLAAQPRWQAVLLIRAWLAGAAKPLQPGPTAYLRE